MEDLKKDLAELKTLSGDAFMKKATYVTMIGCSEYQQRTVSDFLTNRLKSPFFLYIDVLSGHAQSFPDTIRLTIR